MAQFTGLNTPEGLEKLNKHLENASYIVGYQPSKADLSTFDGVGVAPDASQFAHIARWYAHVKSFSPEEQRAFPEVAGASTPAPKKDDDFDLFGEEDEEEKAALEKKKKEEAEKKKAKVVIAKSSIVLDVKPWDDTTDMKQMEEKVRTIAMEGLNWGASKLVAVGYGIKKLQISAVIVDDLVSVDDLEEQITGFEDLVQSVDVAAFNKI
jgi:elongation factor 1-beta